MDGMRRRKRTIRGRRCVGTGEEAVWGGREGLGWMFLPLPPLKALFFFSWVLHQDMVCGVRDWGASLRVLRPDWPRLVGYVCVIFGRLESIAWGGWTKPRRCNRTT
jgi:hypothetical protein